MGKCEWFAECKPRNGRDSGGGRQGSGSQTAAGRSR